MQQETDILILGSGLVGTYMTSELAKSKKDYLVVDIGEYQNELIANTTIETNIEATGNGLRHSLYKKDSPPWGRGCMVIPTQEIENSDKILQSKNFFTSIQKVSKWLGIAEFDLYKDYEIDGSNFIRTQYSPLKTNRMRFQPVRKNILLGCAATKIQLTKEKYVVKLINFTTGECFAIRANKIIIALGTWESARLLLNSEDLKIFRSKERVMHFTDHLSMNTGDFEIPVRRFNHHLGIRNGKVKIHNRFYHKPDMQKRNPQGAISFLEPSDRGEALLKRTFRRLLRNPVCVGQVVGKTMIETGDSDHLELSLGGETGLAMRQLHVKYVVSEETIGLLHEKAREFNSWLLSQGFKINQNFESKNQHFSVYDSLHPSSLFKISQIPSEGDLNLDLNMHQHPNIYCVSSAVLPRAYSVQPTLTILALADLTVSKLIRSKKVKDI